MQSRLSYYGNEQGLTHVMFTNGDGWFTIVRCEVYEMTTKDKILELLKENENRYLSGQQMAEELFVTRAAVWKAIKALQKDGYTVEAITNRGYRLINDYASADIGAINEYLKHENVMIENLVIHKFDEVDSTNDLIRDFEKDSDNVVVIAESQLKGRGRRGRSFFSPGGSGIYMSLLIHPDLRPTEATSLTCVMAVAICRAIKKVLDLDVSIKWVNDIFYLDKKVAGILTEGITSIEDGSLSYVILGIGINLFEPTEGFPKDIKKSAGALLLKQTDGEVKSKLCAAIIASFFELYYDIKNRSYLEEYRDRSMIVGHYVKVMEYGKSDNIENSEYAFVEGIDEDCHLVLKYDNGKIEHLSTGEISVVKY